MPVNPETKSPSSRQKAPEHHKRFGTRIAAGIFLALAITGTFSGCGGYFPLWLRTPEPAPGDPHFTGAWTGRWEHTASGHGGPVQALIPASPGETGDYAVKFRAGWGGFLWGRYTVPTSIEPTGEGQARSLTEKDLGPRQGGTYTLDARITPRSFSGTFRSKAGDLGTVEMGRPK